MHIVKSLVLAAALGASNVVAFSAHRHRHADLHQQHEKRAVGDVVTATIDGKVVTWVNEYSGAAATDAATATEVTTPEADATEDEETNPELRAAPGVYRSGRKAKASAAVSSAPAPSATPSTGASSGTGYKTYTSFCPASVKRATEAEIAYKGNVGSTWGCNMQLIDSSIASQYTYTIKFTGKNTVPWSVWCWNKIGPAGLINGWFGFKAVEFQLAPGATQYVAFDKNTQGSCGAAPGTDLPKDKYGGWGSTWIEFDWENVSNKGWSGADVSSIVAQDGGLKVYGMQAIYNGKKSTIGADMSVIDNAFDSSLKYADGIGFNIAPGPATMEVVVDWHP